MQYIFCVVLVQVLRMIYAPMKRLVKTQKKIVYLSRQSNEPSLDMQLLSKKIQQRNPEYDQVFRLKMLDPGLPSMIGYFFWILGDMVQLAGATVAICDTYSIPVSCLHHKDSLQVVQMWHAMGAVKKFGLQSLGKEDGRDARISQTMKMHQNYDYVLAPSEAMGSFYEEAFGVIKEKIVLKTLPRVDYMLQGKDKSEEFYALNPGLRDKKMVLYLPTFREEEEEIAGSLTDAVGKNPDLHLLLSFHPLSETGEKMASGYTGDFLSYDLMKLADVIITDYSACVFEASLTGAPVYFYVPDYEAYQKKRGLNIDLKEELPDYVFEDAGVLTEAIGSGIYDPKDLQKFQTKYIHDTRDCTRKLADFISLLMCSGD